MNIRINGKQTSFPNENKTLSDLLKHLQQTQKHSIPIQLNGKYIDDDLFQSTFLQEGDELGIVHNVADSSIKKMSIISFSGDFDKLVAAFTLASGASAVGYEVNIFFTFWGLNIIKKKQGRTFVGKGFLARFFGFLMGGPNNTPLSRLNFFGASPKLMNGMMKKRNVATLNQLIEASIALGVNLYACEMSMHILGITKEDFRQEVKEVLGVAKFLEISEKGQTLFI